MDGAVVSHMAESKFVTDRRRRQEDYRKSRPDIQPDRTRSVLSEDERQTMDLPEPPPAPPRGALLRMGPVSGGLEAHGLAGELLGRELNPSFGGRPAQPPVGPNPTKEADRAAVSSAATASVLAEHAREDPSGQGSNQKPPAPPGGLLHAPGGVGTGPGAVAETPPRAARGAGPGPGRTQVKMPDGRFVFVTPDRGADYVGGGGSYASYQDATAGLGAPQAERFMRDRKFRESAPSQPYSSQVRALANAESETPLDFEGDVGFGTSPPGSGGPSGGSRRLSGIEQALARRTWLEGRADTEQAKESERAEVDRRTRLAEMDPLEMARIQAQGRMGGDLAKTALDLRSRQSAVEEHHRTSALIDQYYADLGNAPPGSEEAMRLRRYIDYLVQTRRELSNLILGERLSDPRAAVDALGAAFAGLGLAGGGDPTTGAR